MNRQDSVERSHLLHKLKRFRHYGLATTCFLLAVGIWLVDFVPSWRLGASCFRLLLLGASLVLFWPFLVSANRGVRFSASICSVLSMALACEAISMIVHFGLSSKK
jgi:hypothetical protein